MASIVSVHLLAGVRAHSFAEEHWPRGHCDLRHSDFRKARWCYAILAATLFVPSSHERLALKHHRNPASLGASDIVASDRFPLLHIAVLFAIDVFLYSMPGSWHFILTSPNKVKKPRCFRRRRSKITAHKLKQLESYSSRWRGFQ